MASDYMLGFVVKDKDKAAKVFKLSDILDEYGTSHGTGSIEWIVL